MYLKSLRLENIACFEELDLDFTDENGEPCKWVVLLGENGTGKSSILDGIIGASGLSPFYHRIRTDCDKAIALIGLVPTSEDEGYDLYKSGVDINIGWEIHKNGGKGIGSPSQYSSLLSGDLTKGYFIGGYGVRRRLNLDKNDNAMMNSFSYSKNRRFISLLGMDEKLTPPKIWLSSLDFEYIKWSNIAMDRPVSIKTLQGPKIIQQYTREEQRNAKRKSEIVEKEYHRAISAIESIFAGNVKFIEVTPDKDIVFEENGIEVLIDDLSDGYQSTISWIGDLVRQLCEDFPDMDNPLTAHGVVLIDELDLHLHPRWQREIVRKVRNIFPNLQFIVTTHSPFVAQDMTEKDKIIVLTREGDKVTAHEERGFVQNWRAGQILTSWLFGLSTDYDEKIEEKLGKQQELADRKAQGLLTEEEREELRQVTEFLSTLPSEETGAELLSQDYLDREAVRKAAATALKLLRKVEGK